MTQLLLPLVFAANLLPVPEERELGGSAKRDGPDDAGGAKVQPPPPVVTEGRIVLFRVGGTEVEPELRPAIVVKAWNPTSVNLQVFVDGTNDRLRHYPGEKDSDHRIFSSSSIERGMAWKTSVVQGTGIGQWRWPTRG